MSGSAMTRDEIRVREGRNSAPNGVVFPKWALGCIVSRLYGYTEDAMRKKRERGIWIEGVHWVEAPDGRIVYNPAAIEEWMESGFKTGTARRR